jgi:tol-pal system protein YbgF
MTRQPCVSRRLRVSGMGHALASLLLGTACARPAAHMPTQTPAAANAEVVQLRNTLKDRDELLRQWESRLALVEAEQRQFRYALEEQHSALPVTNGKASTDRTTPGGTAQVSAAPSNEAREPRLVLRLHEDRGRSHDSAPLQDVPVVNERLSVAPLPSTTPVSLAAPQRALPQADDTYAAALDALAARDFRAAAMLFERFIAVSPRDPRSSKAAYWRAESLFALHAYAAALAGFESYLDRNPQGDRAPDAWLKLGLSKARSGDRAGARSAFEELRRRFPESPAARMSVEEEP